ncbi:hypothetical protein X832_gp074 [Pseudomonas phage PAK_P5]|uniref:Uncharacterized protein n=1 Tax=Pseudomonas phage PAK_P5 TaxID=1327964 RepID=V5JXD2_9CAUD|nr:hypothetical protein X832_gp074 [Pseudomonas phage PAK_P5]AGR89544.1 hypothetical protein PAK_P500074 [Pseudomonas phage PAK_P5]
MNKTIRKQLNDHYDRQGLTGNHRRLAMKADLRLVEKYTDPDTAAWLKSEGFPVGLGGAFVWANTPEGHNFWWDKEVPNR